MKIEEVLFKALVVGRERCSSDQQLADILKLKKGTLYDVFKKGANAEVRSLTYSRIVYNIRDDWFTGKDSKASWMKRGNLVTEKVIELSKRELSLLKHFRYLEDFDNGDQLLESAVDLVQKQLDRDPSRIERHRYPAEDVHGIDLTHSLEDAGKVAASVHDSHDNLVARQKRKA